MCTIVMLADVHPEAPLIVAANRDEYYHRRATGPQVLVDGPTRVLGGRDEVRAGTWMGVTARGFFVGVTNQRTGRPADTSLRSRGEVVLAALTLGDTTAVERYVRALDGRAYNAFNLAFGDAGALRVAYVRREEPLVTVVALPSGVHVLANDRLDSPDFPKAQRAARRVESETLRTRGWDALARSLMGVLADHEVPPEETLPPAPPGSLMPAALLRRLQALCVHTPVYGTVSATMLALAPGRVQRYLYADGAPCRASFRDLTGLATASTGSP